MSKFKQPTKTTGTGTQVQSMGATKTDGTSILPSDLEPSLIHDSDPGVAALGQGKILATQSVGVFKNAV